MKELEKIYGITIDNSEIFKHALTHPSYTQENNLPYCENYERFEFLGDAVLKLVTSEILYKKYPQYLTNNSYENNVYYKNFLSTTGKEMKKIKNKLNK